MTDESEIIVEETEAILEVEENTVVIEDARVGPQGPAGPPGPKGDDSNYTHHQTTPSEVWVIEHGLDKFPAVDVVDSASNVVIGEIHYDNPTRVTITFQSAFAGRAFLN